MSSSSRAFGLATIFVAVCLSPQVWAQAPQAPPVNPDSPTPAVASTPPPAAVANNPAPPPPDPKILEDGGISLEPIYWLNRSQPSLKGGKTATAYGNYNYLGNAKPAIGAELGIPAGRANTLRFSYFRVQGNSSYALTKDATYFSELYNAGDYVVASYKIQSAKISWDYLSYTFSHSKIKFKTLYEMQFVTISSDQSAPLKAEVTDASGNTDTNSSNGSKNLFLPTFGVEFEQPISKHVRWEVKASGFGLPRRSVIWDAQAVLAIRFSSVELIAGGKAFHFKNSPSGEEYFADTLDGAYVGLRYYLGQRAK